MSRERDRSGGSHKPADRSDAPYDPDPKIFVGGLPFSLSPDEIRDLFEAHGTILEFHLPRVPHDPRKHKGFGFITYDNFKTMDTVIHKMHQKELAGQVITVTRATINTKRHDGPDRGGTGQKYGSSGPDRSYGSGGGRDYGYNGRDYGSGRSGGSGGYDSRGAGGKYDDRSGGGGGRYEGRSYTPYDTNRPAGGVRKPIGYRCRVTGLAPDVDWRLLKDFLRQIGDVTYANVDDDGRGVGEYQTLAEVRDAIDKLTGAAINGSVVKVAPLNFDLQTGQKFDINSQSNPHYSDRPNSRYDFSRGSAGHASHQSDARYDSRSNRDGGRYDSRYDDRGHGGGGYSSRSDRGTYGAGGYNSRGGGSYGARERERSPVGGRSGGSYRDNGAAGSGGYGGGSKTYGSGGGYDRTAAGGYGAGAGGTGGRYGGSSGAGGAAGYGGSAAAAPAAGGSSRYGGGGTAAAAAAPHGGSSRYGGSGAAVGGSVPSAVGGAAAGDGQGYDATGAGGGDGYGRSWRVT